LKDALKTDYVTPPTKDNPKPKRKPWTEEDEQRFVKQLEAELDKVFTFQKVKSQEIVKRIKASEQEVKSVVAQADQHQQAPNEPQSGQADVSLEEDFMLLEEDLSDIIADVHDLARFTQLNYTGFQKIIKKHDVRLPDLTFQKHKLTIPETNKMVPEARLRCTAEGKALFQGQL
jgi:SPX domain protein involved in polyphosphate accumulation